MLMNLFFDGIVEGLEGGIFCVASVVTTREESLEKLLNSGGSRFVDGTFGYRPVKFDSKTGGVN